MGTITERRPIPGPRVYGYLRLPRRSRTRRAALTETLIVYCQQHELLLGGVFTELSSPDVLAPAFAALLDAVGMGGCYGVLAPTPGHLGGGYDIERQRTLLLAETRLMFVRNNRAGHRGAPASLFEPPH